jgi:hypothetical protein
LIPFPHSLNPLNVSEGGDSLVSPFGAALQANVPRMYGPITILARHENLPFPGLIGDSPITFTPRPSLPLIEDNWPGPIHLGPPVDKRGGR